MKNHLCIPSFLLLLLWLVAAPALQAQVTAPASPTPPIQSGGDIARHGGCRGLAITG